MSRRRAVMYGCALAAACCLYFFENNTGTRIAMIFTAVLPLFPAVRTALFSPDRYKERTRRSVPLRIPSSRREADESGDVRTYLPGDPVNRIHWKLSAKRDELLIRQAPPETAEDEPGSAPAPADTMKNRRKRRMPACLAAALLAGLLLVLIPQAQRGAQALCNRLFEASEAVNAYAYERFPVPAGQAVWPAVLLLSAALAALLGGMVISGSRAAAFGVTAACAAFQVYFGLSLPAWGNVLLFLLFVLAVLRRPWTRAGLLRVLAAALAVSAAVALILPGTDAGTEAASEKARDMLSRMAQHIAGDAREWPEGETETRHVHSLTLETGDREAAPEKEYRLLTVEEEQISMPHGIDYLKIACLLLLTAAVTVLPFLPFLLVNARRKRAMKAREAFRSPDVGMAVEAIFQHVIAWLEATDRGAGNVPYREWAPCLSGQVSEEYARLFRPCAELFEQAAYSGRALEEADRLQALDLLKETEQALRARADLKQRLRLKYREWLWI